MKKAVSIVLLLLMGSSTQCMDSSAGALQAAQSPKHGGATPKKEFDRDKLTNFRLEFESFINMTTEERLAFLKKVEEELPSRIAECKRFKNEVRDALNTKPAAEDKHEVATEKKAPKTEAEIHEHNRRFEEARAERLRQTELEDQKRAQEILQRAKEGVSAPLSTDDRWAAAEKRVAERKRLEQEAAEREKAATAANSAEEKRRADLDKPLINFDEALDKAVEDARKADPRIYQPAERAAQRTRAQEGAAKLKQARAAEATEEAASKGRIQIEAQEAVDRMVTFLNKISHSLETGALIETLTADEWEQYKADRAVVQKLEAMSGLKNIMAKIEIFERHPAGKFVLGVMTREQFDKAMAAENAGGAGVAKRASVPVIDKTKGSRDGGPGDGGGKKNRTVLRNVLILGTLAGLVYAGYRWNNSRKKAA